jgi:hypothetical protein
MFDTYLGGRYMDILTSIAWKVGLTVLVGCATTLVVKGTVEAFRESSRSSDLSKKEHEYDMNRAARKEEDEASDHEDKFPS